MTRDSNDPQTRPWAEGRRQWIVAGIAIPVLCALIGAGVTLATANRDDPSAAQPSSKPSIPLPDKSNPCRAIDDDSLTWGWGPDRPTVTGEQFTETASMNSDRANPNYGDERQFVLVKDADNNQIGGWQNEINVESGKSYLIRLYVHNSADGAPEHAAHNVRVSANVPNCTAHRIRIDGFIDADDTYPIEVYSNVILQSDRYFNITFKPGSAKYYNNYHTKGIQLSDQIVTSKGALAGCETMDGTVPGNYECSGVATFEVVAQSPN